MCKYVSNVLVILRRPGLNEACFGLCSFLYSSRVQQKSQVTVLQTIRAGRGLRDDPVHSPHIAHTKPGVQGGEMPVQSYIAKNGRALALLITQHICGEF